MRATTDERRHAGVGTWHPRTLIEGFLDERFETSPNVFFVPHDVEQPMWSDASPIGAYPRRSEASMERGIRATQASSGSEPRRVATSACSWSPRARIWVASTPWQLTLLGMYAEVGANVAETLVLAKEIGASQNARELSALRRELMDELLLHRHLVEIGGRLGVSHAAAAPSEVFPLLAERLHEVLPIKSLTINRVDDLTRTFRPIYHSEPGKVAEAMLRFEAPIGAGATGRGSTGSAMGDRERGRGPAGDRRSRHARRGRAPDGRPGPHR